MGMVCGEVSDGVDEGAWCLHVVAKGEGGVAGHGLEDAWIVGMVVEGRPGRRSRG